MKYGATVLGVRCYVAPGTNEMHGATILPTCGATRPPAARSTDSAYGDADRLRQDVYNGGRDR
eukprot:640367-Rhodomonas_salina.4